MTKEALTPEVVPIPHHIKAAEMEDCKKCEYYEYVDSETFYCRRWDQRIRWIR